MCFVVVVVVVVTYGDVAVHYKVKKLKAITFDQVTANVIAEM